MYIKNIKIQNFGPISNLNIEPQFDSFGNPKPIVFIGKNGSGKTLLLGNILDCLVELKRKKYPELLEVPEKKLFKIGSKSYIKNDTDYSYVNIQLIEDQKTATYCDLMTNLNHSDFLSKYSGQNFEGANDNSFKKNGFYKQCNLSNNVFVDSIDTNIISFFPHSRYDHPAWLNKETTIGFAFREKFINQSDKSIIKQDVIKEIETWILDCLLDREIYEKQLLNVQNSPIPNMPLFAGYNGKNSDIINLINQLLGIIFKSKFPNLESARIGIGAKNRRNISIHIKENNQEFVVSPSFSHLSSGEVMLLSLFTSLLKEYDDLGIQVRNLNDVKGVVIIDEIDLHLHIEFQKTILPELIKRFSKVQFILTSHSPFFLYGMDETYKENWDLINLPYGNKIGLHDYSEMKTAYDIFVKGFNNLQNTFNTVNKRLRSLSKPIIITEGKTDWKHLKNAITKLNEENKYLELDFDFLEYEDDIQMGDSHLKSLCEQTSKLINSRKVICIFDRDCKDIINTMGGSNGSNYKSWGNNVYSLCIPTPSHRLTYNNISIEFYYSDAEIQTIDQVTNRRLFFSNEVEEVRVISKTNKKKSKSEIRILDTPIAEDENDKKIYCEDVEFVKNANGENVAHSKNVFAENILNKTNGFDNFNVLEFEKIFEVIGQILTE